MVDTLVSPGTAPADLQLDFDSRRAEHGGQQRSVKVGGRTFPLPAQLSVGLIKRAGRLANLGPAQALEAVDTLFEALFGERAEEAADLLTVDELVLIFQQYGVTTGESSASLAS